MKWIGKKMLSGLIAVESRRLVWSAGRMLHSMDKVPGDELQSWVVSRQQKIDRLLDDLLELTSYAQLFIGSALYLMPSFFFAVTEQTTHRKPRKHLSLTESSSGNASSAAGVSKLKFIGFCASKPLPCEFKLAMIECNLHSSVSIMSAMPSVTALLALVPLQSVYGI
jgi:hypothetical protein